MKLPRTISRSTLQVSFGVMTIASVLFASPVLHAQVRTKKPDRGVYQPPRVTTSTAESNSRLIPVPIEDVHGNPMESSDQVAAEGSSMTVPKLLPRRAKLQQVGHNDVVLMDPTPTHGEGEIIVEGDSWPAPIETWSSEGGEYYEGDQYYEGGYGDVGCGIESCDSYGCDGYGCDSIGCNRCGPGNWANASLVFRRDRWFANFELLLMFRSGDYLPPLFTTGPATATNPGRLGQASTRILAGGGEVLNELTAGGRLTVGTWLDDCHSRSMVARGWGTGEETYNFSADQSTTPIITRPFFNVTTGQAATQDTQVVATPGFTNAGFANVHASSNVYGADLSIRQHAYSRFGGTVDVLYGYQYMHLSEDLITSSTSTAGANNPAPLGSVIAISDSFDAQNDFHGGQIGIASRYREGCWSFNSLFKVAAGNLRREATLAGQTQTSNGPTFTDPNGLLVRSTNSGTRTDDTFGWVPEIDLSLGWRYFPQFDVTFGYHIIAMTDALQVSGLVDNQLASNLADPVSAPLRPSSKMDYKTFYVHGIHFGLQYVY
ncbi:BBP7 family outer membrane beta-barrel protein [Novipirellula sp. SH528]|uniref:BBP7 family outer membrane beta-barrel protein n=1 Tax=Novipirellula sp. SH528 TaxID=3454466 RepID=UPI003F9F78BC